MSRLPVRGSLVALVTPFNDDGSVNFEKLGELIDFHLENETDALVILGTTGESSTMSHEEDNAVCEYTVKRVAGRIPVICGSGSNDTRTMLESRSPSSASAPTASSSSRPTTTRRTRKASTATSRPSRMR